MELFCGKAGTLTIKYCQTALQSGYTNLLSNQEGIKVAVSPHLCQYLDHQTLNISQF